MRKQSKTIIAAIRTKRGKIIMGGDRQVSLDWGFKYKCPKPKIRKHKSGILIGASGDSDLCKLVVDIFKSPDIDVDDPEIYMYYKFLPSLVKLLKSQVGYIDQHKLLKIHMEENCCVLVACMGNLYTVDIYNPSVDGREESLGRIAIDDAPLPYAIGCGAPSAMPILFNAYKEKGYNTKEDLSLAMTTAAELSPGCDNEQDFITE